MCKKSKNYGNNIYFSYCSLQNCQRGPKQNYKTQKIAGQPIMRKKCIQNNKKSSQITSKDHLTLIIRGLNRVQLKLELKKDISRKNIITILQLVAKFWSSFKIIFIIEKMVK